MRNKLLISVLCAVMLLGTIAGAVSITFGWLTPGKTVPVTADGSAVASYFARGTGDEDDPYILTNAKHVYNLAWLQYMGVFNTEKNDDGTVKQFYFEVDNNINMAEAVENTSYQVIPPIGTIEYPFIGHFDGKGKIISNAIVSNVIANGEIIVYPPSVDQVRDAEIIGFFGVIGEFTDDTILTTKEQLQVLSVSNLLLDQVIIQTSATQSLAGLFAGYVNGNLTDVHVASGTITARPNVSALTGTYGALEVNKNGALSAYSLIGDYNTTDINWLGGPMDGPTSDSGQNAGFGGSIDMLSLAKRVTFMLQVPDSTETPVSDKQYLSGYTYNSKQYRYEPKATVSNFYGLYGHFSKTNNIECFTYDKYFTFTFLTGNYLPLNIDLGEETANLTAEKYAANYSANTKEVILSTNTGYIVGGGISTMTIGSREFGRIYGSFVEDHTNRKTTSGDNNDHTDFNSYNATLNSDGSSKIRILTKTGVNEYYVIGDHLNKLLDNWTGSSSPTQKFKYDSYEENVEVKDVDFLRFTQYEKSDNNIREKFEKMLSSNPTFINGIAFSKLGTKFSDTDVSVLDKSVSLGGASVSDLVANSINFSVANRGVISMIAGTFYGGSSSQLGADKQALPELYQVFRDSDKKVDHLEKITEVYEYNGQYYYYKVHDDATLRYSSTWTETLTAGKGTETACFLDCLFYFEIPVEAGEFALLPCATAQSAYLLYLDIGGNAGTQGPGSEDNPGGTTAEYTGELNGVYFVDGLGADRNPILQNVTPDAGKTAPAVAFEIMLSSNPNGTSISFDGSVSGVITTSPIPDNATITLVVKKEEETDGS